MRMREWVIQNFRVGVGVEGRHECTMDAQMHIQTVLLQAGGACIATAPPPSPLEPFIFATADGALFFPFFALGFFDALVFSFSLLVNVNLTAPFALSFSKDILAFFFANLLACRSASELLIVFRSSLDRSLSFSPSKGFPLGITPGRTKGLLVLSFLPEEAPPPPPEPAATFLIVF